MSLQKMCEGCGLKHPSYGLPAERRARWCAGCATAEGNGAVLLQQQMKCAWEGPHGKGSDVLSPGCRRVALGHQLALQ